jgi:hypothetical protein
MIKQFLITHPLLSPHSIEKLLQIPSGTIRLSTNRPIPEKYLKSITDLLTQYGFKPIDGVSALQEQVVEHIDTPIVRKPDIAVEPVKPPESKKVNTKRPSVWDSMKELRRDK